MTDAVLKLSSTISPTPASLKLIWSRNSSRRLARCTDATIEGVTIEGVTIEGVTIEGVWIEGVSIEREW